MCACPVARQTSEQCSLSCHAFSSMLGSISATECNAVPQSPQTFNFFSYTMFFKNPTKRIPARWGYVTWLAMVALLIRSSTSKHLTQGSAHFMFWCEGALSCWNAGNFGQQQNFQLYTSIHFQLVTPTQWEEISDTTFHQSTPHIHF